MSLSPAKKSILNINANGQMDAIITCAKRKKPLRGITAQLNGIGQPLSLGDFATANGPLGQLMFKRGQKQDSAIDIIDQILTELAEIDELPSFHDWVSTRNSEYSLMEWATKRKVLAKIFQPQFWAGRTDQMNLLWNQIPERGQQQVKDFFRHVAEAEGLGDKSGQQKVNVSPSGLFVPNNEGAIPADDIRVWRNLQDVIDDAPVIVESPIITHDHMVRRGRVRASYIELAYAAGALPVVQKYLREHDRPLTRGSIAQAGMGHVLKEIDTAFINYCRLGNTGAVSNLIEAKIVDFGAITDRETQPAPIAAATAGHAEVLDLCYSNGADPDLTCAGKGTLTALWQAARHNRPAAVSSIVRALKEKHANDPVAYLDSLHATHDSLTPLGAAKKHSNADTTAALSDTLIKAAEAVATLPIEKLLEGHEQSQGALFALKRLKMLPDLFRPGLWVGNVQAMQNIAEIVTPAEVDSQLIAAGRPSFGTLMTIVNAQTLKR